VSVCGCACMCARAHAAEERDASKVLCVSVAAPVFHTSMILYNTAKFSTAVSWAHCGCHGIMCDLGVHSSSFLDRSDLRAVPKRCHATVDFLRLVACASLHRVSLWWMCDRATLLAIVGV
jgi:hypothetical protein